MRTWYTFLCIFIVKGSRGRIVMVKKNVLIAIVVAILIASLCCYVVFWISKTSAKTHIVQVIYTGLEAPSTEVSGLMESQRRIASKEFMELPEGTSLRMEGNLNSNATLVRVTGSATIEVAPDLLILRISVSSTGKTAGEAVKNASEIINKIIDKLKDLGISKGEIETDYYHLMTVYDYEVKPPKIVGYKAVHVLKVEVKDKELAGTIIDEVSKFKIERITVSSSLSTKSYKEAYLKALEQALSDALSKVEVIAKMLNMEVGRVREVHESTSYGIIRYTKAPEVMVVGTRATKIYPEKVSVKSTVTMIVELVKG